MKVTTLEFFLNVLQQIWHVRTKAGQAVILGTQKIVQLFLFLVFMWLHAVDIHSAKQDHILNRYLGTVSISSEIIALFPFIDSTSLPLTHSNLSPPHSIYLCPLNLQHYLLFPLYYWICLPITYSISLPFIYCTCHFLFYWICLPFNLSLLPCPSSLIASATSPIYNPSLTASALPELFFLICLSFIYSSGCFFTYYNSIYPPSCIASVPPPLCYWIYLPFSYCIYLPPP